MTRNYASTRPSTFHAFTWYVFALAAVMQPPIVIGFWALVYPFSRICDYRCGTVHGAGFVLTYIELIISKLPITNRLLPLILAYPITWTISQVIWIYTGHKPDYTVLPMDNWASLFLTVSFLLSFLGAFYTAKVICRWRDRKWGFPNLFNGRGGPPASAYFGDISNPIDRSLLNEANFATI